jgi:hypothetical protein
MKLLNTAMVRKIEVMFGKRRTTPRRNVIFQRAVTFYQNDGNKKF